MKKVCLFKQLNKHGSENLHPLQILFFYHPQFSHFQFVNKCSSQKNHASTKIENYVKFLVTGFFDEERKAAKNQMMFTAAEARQSPITVITSESGWSPNTLTISTMAAVDK